MTPQRLLRGLCLLALTGGITLLAAPDTAPAWQPEQLAKYLAEMAPRVRAYHSPYQHLPTGLPEGYQAAYQALFDFLRDDRSAFDQLQWLERDVVYTADTRHLDRKEAFLRRLGELEAEYGFAPVHHETAFLTREAFMKLLKAGKPIYDSFFVGKAHTVHGHRVMSILASRYLASKFHDRHLYAKLYRQMGDRDVMKQLHWEGTGIDVSKINYADIETLPDLYGYLHDSSFFTPEHFAIQADDFTNPLFVSQMRRYVPGLVGWE